MIWIIWNCLCPSWFFFVQENSGFSKDLGETQGKRYILARNSGKSFPKKHYKPCIDGKDLFVLVSETFFKCVSKSKVETSWPKIWNELVINISHNIYQILTALVVWVIIVLIRVQSYGLWWKASAFLKALWLTRVTFPDFTGIPVFENFLKGTIQHMLT